jgi:serine/threonine-protein kinase
MAQLDHPSIVTLLDGGVTQGGQPYLVMRYVEGVPITRYADERAASLRDRLRLFAAVCDAVQFAHAHLVVHRDLKPSNILVDAEGKPRLLDFGIAKLLDPTATASTTGDLLLLTPEHAAPEQFLGNPVTTATDVYALGVLLYELLCGTRPFRDVPPPDLPRAVCHEPPAPPSAHRPVPPDLDQIVLMALRKEPARRYASAGQLGEDVVRFLGGWPVVARPDTARYRLGRFVARNRVSVAATATVILALVGATGWSIRQSAQRAAALEVAEGERTRANRITNFLLGVFRATNPSETRGRTVTARELLDQAAARVAADLAQEPAARADMQLAIGQAYSFVGLTAAAESLFAIVTEARMAMTPPRPTEVATAKEWLARARMAGGKLEQGLSDMKEVVAIRERELGPDAVQLVPALQRIALASHQRAPAGSTVTDSSLEQLRRALTILEKADSGRTMAAAELLRLRAWMIQDQGKDAEALEVQRRAVEVATAAARDLDDPVLFNFKETLALMLTANGHLDSAIAIHRDLLAARRRVYGPVSDNTSFSLFNLASVLRDAGKLDEAAVLIKECIAVREQVFGLVHPQTGFAIGVHAGIMAMAGDHGGALAEFRRAIAILEETVGPNNPSVLNRYEAVAMIQVRMGRRDDALATLRTLVDRGYRNLSRSEFAGLSGTAQFQALSARVRRDSARASAGR